VAALHWSKFGVKFFLAGSQLARNRQVMRIDLPFAGGPTAHKWSDLMKVFLTLFAALIFAAAAAGASAHTYRHTDPQTAAEPAVSKQVRSAQSTHNRWRSHYRWGSSQGRRTH
jgi:hypothetical protein